MGNGMSIHQIPWNNNRCILCRKGQGCEFSQKPTKDDTMVFIIAPVVLNDLIEEVKKIVKDDYHLDPVTALDIREYNSTATCSHICGPMLKAGIVIAIGDWKNNSGNVNVAWEYGIATAMGCEVIPIRIDYPGKGPFDLVGLNSILVAEDWVTNPASRDKFNKEFKEYFEKTEKKIQLKEYRALSPIVNNQLEALIKKFNDSIKQEYRQDVVSLIQNLCNIHYDVLRDSTFTEWIIRTTIRYAKSRMEHLSIKDQREIGICPYALENGFLNLLEKAVEYNYWNSDSSIITNLDFHRALHFMATGHVFSFQTRKTAIECMLYLAPLIEFEALLSMIFKVIEDVSMSKEDFNSLALTKSMQEMFNKSFRFGPEITPIFELLYDRSENGNPIVAERASALLKEMRNWKFGS